MIPRKSDQRDQEELHIRVGPAATLQDSGGKKVNVGLKVSSHPIENRRDWDETVCCAWDLKREKPVRELLIPIEQRGLFGTKQFRFTDHFNSEIFKRGGKLETTTDPVQNCRFL